MLIFQYSLYVALFSTFGIAIANLGITGYLLALVRDPNTARRQYYVLVNPVLRVLSPMSILPGWVLEESSWFTLATSMITIVDVPIIGFILWRRQRLGSNDRVSLSTSQKHNRVMTLMLHSPTNDTSHGWPSVVLLPST